MRSSVLALLVVSVLAPSVVVAAELDPLAVTVDVPTDPAMAEAIQRCAMAKVPALARLGCKYGDAGEKRVACEAQNWTEPQKQTDCRIADDHAAAVAAARVKAEQARDDCIKADPVAFTGYVNLRNRTPVTTEQMTVLRHCVERASQAKR